MSWEYVLSEDDYRFYRENISLLEERVLANFADIYKNSEILSAIRKVPRHLFVNPAYRSLAYTDNALPTSGGMTTSAPSVVAEMVFNVGIGRDDRLLEIGTGTGYEAAVLAEMGVKVFSIEVDKQLAEKANKNLAFLGYKIDRSIKGEERKKDAVQRHNRIRSFFPSRGSIELFWGNGALGLESHAPFKGIIAAASIPQIQHVRSLVEQLSSNGGRLIVPVGGRHRQDMYIVEKKGRRITSYVLDGVSFDFVRMVLPERADVG